MEWRDRITVEPDVCHGKACIRGTRIPASVILDNLAEGVSVAEILEEYPSVSEADVLAAIAYGAELSRERVIDFDVRPR
jgi:uncharacterized protein (DUF433 family)